MLKRTLPLLLVLLAGCTYEGGSKLPGVYRLDVQQGNVVDQKMVDQLRPGMDKNQVQYIMGTPVLNDPFHADRWDYVYTFSSGGSQRDQRNLTLYFKDNKLFAVGGDVVPGKRPANEVLKQPSRTVVVPPDYNKRGFFHRLLNDLPIIGDGDSRQRDSTPESGPDNDGD